MTFICRFVGGVANDKQVAFLVDIICIGNDIIGLLVISLSSVYCEADKLRCFIFQLNHIKLSMTYLRQIQVSARTCA